MLAANKWNSLVTRIKVEFLSKKKRIKVEFTSNKNQNRLPKLSELFE